MSRINSLPLANKGGDSRTINTISIIMLHSVCKSPKMSHFVFLFILIQNDSKWFKKVQNDVNCFKRIQNDFKRIKVKVEQSFKMRPFSVIFVHYFKHGQKVK